MDQKSKLPRRLERGSSSVLPGRLCCSDCCRCSCLCSRSGGVPDLAQYQTINKVEGGCSGHPRLRPGREFSRSRVSPPFRNSGPQPPPETAYLCQNSAKHLKFSSFVLSETENDLAG
ncbi:Hypothetical protein NTJ_06713 [Nesidiocoris tenuis]|uniref:Uncharacterized protein n=1 Tax=Nesidiocoris tenuis TaxID=355587 RepID=A0ABN7APB1_9HEMI|nr:Hypothetical protein NTJ_06713 [Nesidiocoris tenuis]